MPGYQRGIRAREMQPARAVTGAEVGFPGEQYPPCRPGAHNHGPRFLNEAVRHLAKGETRWRGMAME